MEFVFHFVLNVRDPDQDDSCHKERELRFKGDLITLGNYNQLFKHLTSLVSQPQNEVTRFSNENCDMNAIWNLIRCPKCDYHELRTQVIEQLDGFKVFYEELKAKVVPNLIPACEDGYFSTTTCSFCTTQLWTSPDHVNPFKDDPKPNHKKVQNFRICLLCYNKYR